MADLTRKTANLFDLSVTRTQYSCNVAVSDSTVTQTNTGSYARSQWLFELISGNTYTIKTSFNNPNGCSLRINVLDDSSRSYIESDITTDTTGEISLTFTARSDSTYIRLYSNTLSTVNFNSVVFSNIMLNEGQTALPYEPYGWLHSLRKLTTATEAVESPLYSDGTAITSYTIKGNTVQNGTPTPSNPVMPNGVGERTENLFDKDNAIMNKEIDGLSYKTSSNYYITDFIPVTSGETYSKNDAIGTSLLLYHNADFNETVTQKISIAGNGSFTIPEGYIVGNGRQVLIDIARINKGSELLPYEPYGYKIPIPNGQQTTNIYLGSTQSERKIYKWEFTGNEAWNINDVQGSRFFYVAIPSAKAALSSSPRYCSHFTEEETFINPAGAALRIYDQNSAYADTTAFKAFLTAQYSAGTPVTLWYVLATPETAAVNEPLMKIGTYADTLSNAAQIPTTEGANSITVDTTVQPSEFTATWTGWHDSSVKEWDGSQWND